MLTAMNTRPLLALFQALRRRGFPLGISEYTLSLNALAKGVVGDSRWDVLFMIQTLWGKTREDQALIADLYNQLLPREITPQVLESLESQSQPGELTPPDSGDVRYTNPRLSENWERQSQMGDVVPDEPAMANVLPFRSVGIDGDGTLDVPMLQDMVMHFSFDFTGALPITRRQMKRAWRYYRRMQRTGLATELDIETTIRDMHRTGVLLKPGMVSRRVNTARVVIFVDEGGSMIPFRQLTTELLDTAERSGLAEVRIYTFYNLVRHMVRKNTQSREPVFLNRLLESVGGAGVLIVSDGGAARGNLDEDRVKTTIRFIERLRRAAPQVVWLNPVPQDRWRNTSADAIRTRSGVPMFPLDRTGLDAAIDALRGRRS